MSSEPSGSPRVNLWRQTQNGAAQPGAAPARNRRQLYVAIALVLALLGATAAWLFFPSQVNEPSFLGVWIDQYDDPLVPPNAWAAQDRKALKDLPWRHINAFSSQELRLLRQVLNKLRDDPPDQPVVVFLCAYAATRPDGAVFLLPGDARIADQGTWLPLTEILGYVRACRARHKLLLLDLMRPFTEPRLGILLDDVPARTQVAIEAAVKLDPHLQVLWACAPGQHSLVSDDLSHSVFAYYLHEGLKGRAEGYGGPRNGRVSVRELSRFVQARVDRWSTQTGHGRQTPRFRGAADDFDLVAMPEQPAPPAPIAEAPPYPDWLKAGWQLRDRWWKETWDRAPWWQLRALESSLLRAEQRLSAGMDPAVVRAKVEDEIKDQEKRRNQARTKTPAGPVTSLAREVVRGKQPPDLSGTGVLGKYNALLDLAAKVRKEAKPSEKERERLDNERAALLKQLAGKPFEFAWLVFENLARPREQELRQDRVRFVSELLASGEPLPPYEELAFVQRLADWKVDAKDWPGATALEALRLAKKAAQAAAAAEDPRVRPWVKTLLDAAQAKRQSAERLLFDPGEATPLEVKTKLNEALETWQRLTDQVQTLTRAYRLRDEAVGRLPAYPPYLEIVPEDAALWERAIEKTGELEELLRRPQAAGDTFATIKKIGKVADTLRDDLMNPLLAQVQARFQTLMERRDKVPAADWLSMSALLRLSWLQAEDRARLWTAARKLSAALNRTVLERDREEDAAQKQTPVPAAVDPTGVTERQRRQALLRARASAALFRLRVAVDLTRSGADPRTVSPPRFDMDALLRAEREPGSAQTWRELDEKLREAWGKVAPE